MPPLAKLFGQSPQAIRQLDIQWLEPLELGAPEGRALEALDGK